MGGMRSATRGTLAFIPSEIGASGSFWAEE